MPCCSGSEQRGSFLGEDLRSPLLLTSISWETSEMEQQGTEAASYFSLLSLSVGHLSFMQGVALVKRSSRQCASCDPCKSQVSYSWCLAFVMVQFYMACMSAPRTPPPLVQQCISNRNCNYQIAPLAHHIQTTPKPSHLLGHVNKKIRTASFITDWIDASGLWVGAHCKVHIHPSDFGLLSTLLANYIVNSLHC